MVLSANAPHAGKRFKDTGLEPCAPLLHTTRFYSPIESVTSNPAAAHAPALHSSASTRNSVSSQGLAMAMAEVTAAGIARSENRPLYLNKRK
jgi:hypothetical protein